MSLLSSREIRHQSCGCQCSESCTCSTATHCNTLQHTATRCNTLQHAATHCNCRVLVARLPHSHCQCSKSCTCQRSAARHPLPPWLLLVLLPMPDNSKILQSWPRVVAVVLNFQGQFKAATTGGAERGIHCMALRIHIPHSHTHTAPSTFCVVCYKFWSASALESCVKSSVFVKQSSVLGSSKLPTFTNPSIDMN